ncbi:MAG: type IX secretion system sortase PorU [Saprospiraceae bacterium]|nr:type IX secretion system sortase PorU [Saprospiraceae bacterium]
MKFTITSLFSTLFLTFVFGQNTFQLSKTLEWSDKDASFKGAIFLQNNKTPVFSYRFPTDGAGRIAVEIADAQFSPLSSTATTFKNLPVNIQPQALITQSRDKFFGNVQITPLRLKNGQVEKLTSFTLIITTLPEAQTVKTELRGTKESVLKDGDIYKFAVKETGIHRLDFSFLKNELKISNLEQIDPRTIKIYGNGGGMLPEANRIERADDLTENNIWISGEDDGRFDANDFILFYAVGPDKSQYDPLSKTFSKPKNIYDDETFYFVKISAGNGARLPVQNSVATTQYTSTSFNDFQRVEDDKTNLLAQHPLNCGQGGGKLWVGDFFTEGNKEKSYSDKFSFPNLITTEPVLVRGQFVAGNAFSSDFTLTVAGTALPVFVSGSSPGDCEGNYGSLSTVEQSLRVPTSTTTLDVKVNYSGGTGSRGWLDFIEIACKRQLTFTGSQLTFRDVKSLDSKATTFQLANANANLLVWDITKPQKAQNQQFTLSGNQLSFGQNTEGVLREFVVFDKTATHIKPTSAVGKIANQNLHGFDDVDEIIIYHKDFEAAAKKLAAHRRNYSKFNIEIAEIGQVYNEFSSGALDPTAIRDFARLLYKRTMRFKYLLLIGDGSFDYKRIYPLGNLQASDFIPPFESVESFSIVDSYPSDDYYGLLSDTEGDGLGGDLDIGVGRIPCKTADEANNVIEKILVYESPTSLGDWRNRVVFMGDNGDGNAHLGSAEYVANSVYNGYRNLNMDKLYIDAYKLDVSAGGTRVPQLNDAIYQNQFKGMLTLCYLGHGGPKGLAQERILMREDLESWRNKDRLPLIVTATCSFSGYDNPKEVSAGEAALLNPNGGAIALFSTVRAVYADKNEVLTKAVFDTTYGRQNFQALRLGDIFMLAKNSSGTGINGNKFALLGDPAIRLALPRYRVATTKINGKTLTSSIKDTVRALQQVSFEGTILDDNGAVMTDFNGTIYPTVYDKEQKLKTLGQSFSNDLSYPQEFVVQRNVLFKGAATVKNGVWSFTFTVPKDIDYAFGKGKISYYAEDDVKDAAGNFEDFVVGGTNPSVTGTDNAPKVEVFINNDKWVSGSTTNANPVLYVKVSDDKGINVSGTSIGHDLTAKLNEAVNPLILNNFYEAVKDDPTKGIVKYPLSNLAAGKYTVSVKAWDIANNAGEGSTEFIVAESGSDGIKKLLSYPNPFSNLTRFRFEHNINAQTLNVKITIYNVLGQLLKTIDQDVSTDGSLVDGISWNGTDDLGNRLGSGIYVYRVVVTTKDSKPITIGSELEKLVFINQ